MFSGIISAIAKIEKTSTKNGCLFLTIKKPKGWKIKPGDSIATNGTCLTVKTVNKNNYTTELMPETLDKTYFSTIYPTEVNLERSLKLSDFMDGHLVTGHIDTVGKITEIIKKGDSKIYKINFAKKFTKLLADKGSVAVDGISLTVVQTKQNWFTISLVDYTLTHTTLGQKKVGDLVHLEFDILAKYINKLFHPTP